MGPATCWLRCRSRAFGKCMRGRCCELLRSVLALYHGNGCCCKSRCCFALCLDWAPITGCTKERETKTPKTETTLGNTSQMVSIMNQWSWDRGYASILVRHYLLYHVPTSPRWFWASVRTLLGSCGLCHLSSARTLLCRTLSCLVGFHCRCAVRAHAATRPRSLCFVFAYRRRW